MISTSALALTLAAGNATQTNEVDFSAMSCNSYEQKLHQASDNPAQMKHIDFINLWLYGYASGKKDSAKISDPASRGFVLKLGEVCHAAPELPLSEAAVKALG